MYRTLMGAAFVVAALATAATATAAEEDIVLRGMGSFHVGVHSRAAH